MEPENFEVTDWRLHVGLMGQLGQKLKDLPPGTIAGRFVSED